MKLAQWAREIERKREERAEQRESRKRRRQKNVQAGGQELHRIRLTAGEKEQLRAKIAERPQRTTHGMKTKIVIYFYMGIMILGVAGSALIIFIYRDVVYPAEAMQSMVSCLIVIALCISWLKLSSIFKTRGLSATVPGTILFVLGSGLLGFRPRSVMVSFLLGIPALMVSYLLCFNQGEKPDN